MGVPKGSGGQATVGCKGHRGGRGVLGGHEIRLQDGGKSDKAKRGRWPDFGEKMRNKGRAPLRLYSPLPLPFGYLSFVLPCSFLCLAARVAGDWDALG